MSDERDDFLEKETLQDARYYDDGTLSIELYYPRQPGHRGGPNTVELGITDVRANDGIRCVFDRDRDGWSIRQPRSVYNASGSYSHDDWVEVFFAQAWHFGTPQSWKK